MKFAADIGLIIVLAIIAINWIATPIFGAPQQAALAAQSAASAVIAYGFWRVITRDRSES